MTFTAKISSQRQITLPARLLEIMDLAQHKKVNIDVNLKTKTATLAPAEPGWRKAFGSIKVPKEIKGKSWKQVRNEARKAWGEHAAKEGIE